mmetsp:Transcript_47123/g.118010  ORF Transcript_47123/g.118010 Transcript_47123/m.118010 type:complete len:239 (-) Transcript_47123:82-798(-)
MSSAMTASTLLPWCASISMAVSRGSAMNSISVRMACSEGPPPSPPSSSLPLISSPNSGSAAPPGPSWAPRGASFPGSDVELLMAAMPTRSSKTSEQRCSWNHRAWSCSPARRNCSRPGSSRPRLARSADCSAAATLAGDGAPESRGSASSSATSVPFSEPSSPGKVSASGPRSVRASRSAPSMSPPPVRFRNSHRFSWKRSSGLASKKDGSSACTPSSTSSTSPLPAKLCRRTVAAYL